MSNICGVDVNNVKAKCKKGVSQNTELCIYNEKTKNCNKKSKKTWEQIEKELAASHNVPVAEVKKVVKEVVKADKKKRKYFEPIETEIDEWVISIHENSIILLKHDMTPQKEIFTVPVDSYENLMDYTDDYDPNYAETILDCGNGFQLRITNLGRIELSYQMDYTIFFILVSPYIISEFRDMLYEARDKLRNFDK